MQPVRQVGIPLDHVAAEMAAFPLASLEALRLGTIQLDPALTSETCRLWRAAEEVTVGRFPGFSLDEVVAIRDLLWFGEQRRPSPLHVVLRRLAAWALEYAGHAALPRLPEMLRAPQRNSAPDFALARRWWRWLTFALPTDLLLAALQHPSRPGEGPDATLLLAPQLGRRLSDAGFAETHLHVGAAIEFPLLWVRALHTIARPTTTPQHLASPGAVLDEGRGLAPWLLRAALVRYLLAAYLQQRTADSSCRDFCLLELPARLSQISLPLAAAHVLRMLDEFTAGQLSDPTGDFAHLQLLYREITEVDATDWSSVTNSHQLLACDPIAELVPTPTTGQPSPEVRWLRQGLAYLEECAARGKPDDWFERLFWQTVRVRCLLFRHITQRPLTPGLPWFVRFFGRISAVRGAISERLKWNLAAELGGRGHGLRSLECRTSPWDNLSELTGLLTELDAIQHDWSQPDDDSTPPLETCLILHFSKVRGGGFAEGEPRGHGRGSHADPGPGPNGPVNSAGYRFQAFFEAQQRIARTVADLFQRFPLALQLVRGIDLCTDELGVPNWVFVPILTQIRQAAAQAIGTIRAWNGTLLPPLRTTIHAGEDFVHLLTGLRHSDEAVTQLQLREGDRLGHGVALGIDPRAWARSIGRAALPREDRLWDLVWQWRWSCCEEERQGESYLAHLEYEIATHAEAMFGVPFRPITLQRLREDLASPAELAAVGFPDGLGAGALAATSGNTAAADESPAQRRQLLHDYLTSRTIFDRGREVIWVDSHGEGERLAALQAGVRRKLGTLGIVVEVNPTSNLLIGNLDDLTSHPLWRLRPPRPADADAPPVGVCIGSDDPVTFNSHLRLEYQCLHDALLLGGLSEDQAQQWLEQARLCSLDHRFSIPRTIALPLQAFQGTVEPEPVPLS
ncbi:MAG: hypothetical protein U0935_05315 [Pirellulales bacterium]